MNQEDLEIVQGTGEILEDTTRSGRRAPWKEKKLMNERICNMFHNIAVRRAAAELPPLMSQATFARLRDCGTFLQFAVDEAGKKRLHRANFCGVRLCPLCQWRRSLIQFHATQEQVSWILERQPDTRFLFVTVTLRNCPPEQLADTLDRLVQGFGRMVNQASRLQRSILMKRLHRTLLGSSRAVEVTYNTRTREMHPHIHAILAVKPSYFTNRNNYLSQQQWVQLWQEAARLDYAPSVDVRAIDATSPKIVAEASKYSAKLSNIVREYENPEESELAEHALESMYLALRGRRLIALTGIFRDAKRALRQEDTETRSDLIHVDDEQDDFKPVEYQLFVWRACVGAYVC